MRYADGSFDSAEEALAYAKSLPRRFITREEADEIQGEARRRTADGRSYEEHFRAVCWERNVEI